MKGDKGHYPWLILLSVLMAGLTVLLFGRDAGGYVVVIMLILLAAKTIFK